MNYESSYPLKLHDVAVDVGHVFSIGEGIERKLYKIEKIARHQKNKQVYVVYSDVLDPKKVWVQPLSDFNTDLGSSHQCLTDPNVKIFRLVYYNSNRLF